MTDKQKKPGRETVMFNIIWRRSFSAILSVLKGPAFLPGHRDFGPKSRPRT